MVSHEWVVPIAAIEHHVYCPRQCALIHVDGLWLDNVHTVRGERGHRRADSGETRSERGRVVLRAVPLWSEALGLSGRSDAVEVQPDGRVVPVEYKIGRRHGQAADLQLCAQAMCLEEMLGISILEGFLWFSGPRRRVPVAIHADLRRQTARAIEEIRSWMKAQSLPPAVDDARCTQCQLLNICQPSISADPERVGRYMEEIVGCGY
ncbi:MAG TPA: CRISPR-associated protein Cas4 [Actinomycetota bacterium]